MENFLFLLQVNKYEESGPNKVTIPTLNKPSAEQYSDEFEKLREERLHKQREKLLKCITLLRLGEEGRKKIIHGIVK